MNRQEIFEDLPQDHPSYGVIGVSVVQSTGHRLVGSDIVHQKFVVLTINKADRTTSFNSDHFYPRENIVRIAMSLTQWGELLSAMNSGGIPCTIERLGNVSIDNPPVINKINRFKVNFRKGFSEQINRIKDLVKYVSDEIFGKTKNGKKALKEKLFSLEHALDNFENNSIFATELFDEHVEQRLGEARNELRAYMKQFVVDKHIPLTPSNINEDLLGVIEEVKDEQSN